MTGFNAALTLLPPVIRAAAAALPEEKRRAVSEFRLRNGYQPTALLVTGEESLAAPVVTAATLQRVLENACGASPYMVRQTVIQGYVTAPGGVRVGLCGRMSVDSTGEYTLAELGSLSIRIPRQVKGCAEGIIDEPFASTLILSPPGWGKTTLLRDMIRVHSLRGTRVALCDERGEVAAFSRGENGFDVGPCTDTITGMPKARCAMALLRAMNPQILAMDEITAPEDVEACGWAANCGVQLLATAHASSLDDLCHRELYQRLLRLSIFKRFISIEINQGQRYYREVAL